MKRLLVVDHTVSPATHALHLAALEGARQPELRAGVEVLARPALSASAGEALEADGYLLGGPVNLGYLAGALKHFFDQIYYPCLDHTAGRPFAIWLHAGGDASGALRALQSITTGLRWRPAQAPVVVVGEPSAEDRAAVTEAAAALTAALLLED